MTGTAKSGIDDAMVSGRVLESMVCACRPEDPDDTSTMLIDIVFVDGLRLITYRSAAATGRVLERLISDDAVVAAAGSSTCARGCARHRWLVLRVHRVVHLVAAARHPMMFLKMPRDEDTVQRARKMAWLPARQLGVRRARALFSVNT